MILAALLLSGSAYAAPQVIYEAPAGKVRHMSRSGMAYYSFAGDVTYGDFYGMCGEIVECDNGDVYLKEPISMAPITNSYIKGKRNGSKVYFNLPQANLSLPNEAGTRDYFYVSLFQWSEEYRYFFRTGSAEAELFGLPDIENEWVLDVDEEGNYSFGSNDSEKDVTILGLYSDLSAEDAQMGSWLSYGELASIWEEFKDEPIEAPADLEFSSMALRYADGAYFVGLGFDGDDVYFKGLFKDQPQAVVKGKLEGDKIILEPGQYVGVTVLETGVSYYSYLKTATADRIWNSKYSLWETTLYPTEAFTFLYNKDEQTLTADNENATLVLNCGNAALNDASYVLNPTMYVQGEEATMNPAAPCNVDFVSTLGAPHLTFDLPLINTYGDVLDINNLYYKIYIDGEEFTFYPDEYPEVSEKEMTMVPYTFDSSSSYRNIMVYGKSHTIYFFLEDVDTYGVQLLYVEDGEVVGESEIITIAAETSDATTPANPEIVGFDNMMMSLFGVYMFIVRLPDYNLNKEKLPLENLYYKYFVNNEEYTLYPADYSAVVDPMSYIPYTFNDTDDYEIFVTGSLHNIEFFDADARTYGVQLFYIVDDVILGKSDIMTIAGPNYSGVEEVNEDAGKEVVSEKYYNLSGAEVAEPQGGIFVKVVTYSDGSRRSFKEVRK